MLDINIDIFGIVKHFAKMDILSHEISVLHVVRTSLCIAAKEEEEYITWCFWNSAWKGSHAEDGP